MSRLLSIAKFEYKMQIKRIAGWIVLLFVLVSSMMDCLPTASNMARIEFLGDIHYYVRRVFSFDGLILLFGILFLTAGRLIEDRKSHRRDLFMAAPIRKASYIGGKLLGNLLFGVTLMYSLLIISLCGFAFFSSSGTSLEAYISAVIDVSLCVILPATFFVVASSVMLPEIMDIRLVYLLYSVLFLVNAFSTDAAEARPFYIFTQGDMAKLIWQHPKYTEIYAGSACLNLLFMLGIGVLAIVLVTAKRRFWRTE
ncbi:MAG: hypothetical protein HDR11_02835 [Lachnospiraceae bacterium]|nr:hypothetical protein [Lachnospiraceae bacterium]